jgi:GAF domain-containing protein
MSAAMPERVIEQCERLLETAGVHALLAHLNARTGHRYTGVYLFDPPILRNASLYDRENPGIVRGGDTPMAETYCSIVGEHADAFATADPAHDPRLCAHPARNSVLAYCGVPLRDRAGECFGTLCHFDLRPRLVPTQEIPVLHAVARILPPRVLALLGAGSDLHRGLAGAIAQRIQIGGHDEADQLER